MVRLSAIYDQIRLLRVLSGALLLALVLSLVIAVMPAQAKGSGPGRSDDRGSDDRRSGRIEERRGSAALQAQAGEVEWRGNVERRPAGAVGVWQVGGRTFRVTAATEVKDPARTFSIGAFVKVHTLPSADGVLIAREIKLETD